MNSCTPQPRMHCLWLLVAIVLSLQFVRSKEDTGGRRSSLDSGVRRKRIINGEELRELNSGYSITNYYTWMSNKHYCGTFDSFGSFFTNVKSFFNDYTAQGYWDCDADPRHLKCGGALLTPTVVQTACHCVGTQLKGTRDKDGTELFVADDPFAQMLVVYHGAITRTADMHRGYNSRLFILHEKCVDKQGTLVYDFGLIVLKTAVQTANSPQHMIPIYSEKNIGHIWSQVNIKETTCLFVGYGLFESVSKRSSPTVLQHTWQVLQNHRRCYSYSSPHVPGFNFTTDGTWSCFLPILSKTRTIIAPGDSGSPVTCNNYYFALVSAGSSYRRIPAHPKPPVIYKIVTDLTLTSAIVFTPFVNTAEQRPAFLEQIKMRIQERKLARSLSRKFTLSP